MQAIAQASSLRVLLLKVGMEVSQEAGLLDDVCKDQEEVFLA